MGTGRGSRGRLGTTSAAACGGAWRQEAGLTGARSSAQEEAEQQRPGTWAPEAGTGPCQRDPAGNRQGRRRPAGSGGGGEVPTAARSSRGSGGHEDPGSFAGGGRARWSCWSGDAPMKKEGDEDEWRHAREDLGRAPWDWAACSSSSSELLSLGRGRRRWSSGSWCCGRRKGAALGLQWLLLLAAALETNPRHEQEGGGCTGGGREEFGSGA